MPDAPTTIFTLGHTLDQIRLLLQAGANDRAAILGSLNQQDRKLDQIISALSAESTKIASSLSTLGDAIARLDAKSFGLSDKIDTLSGNVENLLGLVEVVIDDIGTAIGILRTPVSIDLDFTNAIIEPAKAQRIDLNFARATTAPQTVPIKPGP